MKISEDVDQYFRSTPVDIDEDEETNDLLKDFEEKHLTEQERKLIES